MKRYIDNTKNCLLQRHSSSFILLSITYAQTAQTLCKYRRAVCRIVRFFSSNIWNIKTNNDDDEKKEYGRHKVWLCMSNALRSREFKVMNWTALTQPELQNQIANVIYVEMWMKKKITMFMTKWWAPTKRCFMSTTETESWESVCGEKSNVQKAFYQMHGDRNDFSCRMLDILPSATDALTVCHSTA